MIFVDPVEGGIPKVILVDTIAHTCSAVGTFESGLIRGRRFALAQATSFGLRLSRQDQEIAILTTKARRDLPRRVQPADEQAVHSFFHVCFRKG